MIKKRFLVAAALYASFGFAQENIHFDKSLTYTFESLSKENLISEEKLANSKFVNYINKGGYILSETTALENATDFILNKNEKKLSISIHPFTKEVKVNLNPWFSQEDQSNIVSLEKTDRKGEFNGYKCQYYHVILPEINNSDETTCLCIDDKNETNNVSMLFNTPVKGLLVAIEYSKEFRISLTEKKDVDFSIKFDFDKAFQEQQKMSQDFMQSFAEEASDVEYPEEYDSIDDYIFREYESVYKSLDVDDVSLAYSDLDEEYKKSAPKYCEDLFDKLPDFKNKSLKNHVYNYIGQLCDLYLYENGGNVDYFTTIDSMRKSLLEIEKMRSSLSKKDSELLLQFINSLD
jgi:hypothetical protein